MKFIWSLLLLAFCLNANAQKQDIKAIKEAVEFLAADELKGRETGTEGEDKAAKYIAKKFKEMDLECMD